MVSLSILKVKYNIPTRLLRETTTEQILADEVSGSNMVPTDPFESRVDYSWYKRLMQSAIASNFNMIRLWASGNYYSDDLYDIADERKVNYSALLVYADVWQWVYSCGLSSSSATTTILVSRRPHPNNGIPLLTDAHSLP